ncbi:MAG: alpha/beta hydrolase [Candidatus Binatia bacterium]|nr:alpha/beta hydrolase [Candidatus Binatia bacterium]
MQTGQTIRGATHLAFDAVEQVTHIVEGMYRNISAAPLPFGAEPEGPARGIAGLVHEIIRRVNGGVREISELALAPLSSHLDGFFPPGPQREAVAALLNGVCGDHLERTENPLAIPLQFRTFHEKDAEPVDLRAAVEPGSPFQPSSRVLVLAHGLCMNDRHWTWEGHDHGQMLAERFGYTPVYLRYNSGRHVSANGRALSSALAELLDTWPTEIESITLLGFSMGGLVTRAALQVGEEEKNAWVSHVDKAVYVGTPHHGAALERGGFHLQRVAGFSPYTAPLAALGRIRSDGITDLRHGNIRAEDWHHHDPHEDNADHRRPSPLAEGIAHYAIAGTLSEEKSQPADRLLGDGLVHPESGLGRHADPEKTLRFPAEHVRIVYGRAHLGLLHDPEVAQTLRTWLTR